MIGFAKASELRESIRIRSNLFISLCVLIWFSFVTQDGCESMCGKNHPTNLLVCSGDEYSNFVGFCQWKRFILNILFTADSGNSSC